MNGSKSLPDGHTARRSPAAGAPLLLLLAALVAGVFFIGLYPQPLLNIAQQSSHLLYLGSQTVVSSGVSP